MNKKNLLLFLACCLAGLLLSLTGSDARCKKGKLDSGEQWAGKKAIILGDSISDKIHVGTTRCWWEFLGEYLDMETVSYAVNGSETDGALLQAGKVLEEQGQDFDLLMVFIGTNDFNANIPMGEWFTEEKALVNRNGKLVECLHRTPIMDSRTFKGRLNELALFLKRHFPEKQMVFLTPIHRAYAKFSADNIQPDESWANENGLYPDAYVEAVKELGNLWSFPVIDLNATCGLYPMEDSFSRYFHDAGQDRLHPAAAGHERIAGTVRHALDHLPVF